jgi:hypothetical protein
MRFCPFCAQENTDETSECAHCGRGLPTLGPRTAALPALPKKPALRPPVRPLPRARGVPTPALSGAGPSAHVAASAPERARASTGTVLGLAALDARGEPSGDNATRVDASPFDGPTTQNQRVDPDDDSGEHTSPVERFDEVSEASTVVRVSSSSLPTLRDRDLPEETGVGVPPTEEPATSVDAPFSTKRPSAPPKPAPGPNPLGARALAPSTTPPWGATAREAAPSTVRPPPAPLPPPPGNALPPMRTDPFEPETNPATALPPVSAADADESVVDESLPPMPAPPGPGLMPAVTYLLPLGKAVWARMKAQNTIKEQLHADQRFLDDALHDLGRAAWSEPQRPGELREELERADEDDLRRREADKEVAQLDMSIATERERWVDDERSRKEDIALREAEVSRLEGDLAERRRAQRIEDKVFQTVAARLAAVEKKRDQLIAKAAHAETMPPEKGGGAHTAANLRKEAEDLQREIDGIGPDCNEADARVRALDAPILELEQNLGAAREGLTQAQAGLVAARQANADTNQTLEGARARNEEIKTTAEKGIRLRLVSTGTLLNLHRLDVPQYRAKLAPIYARLDELKQVATNREARIAALDAERRDFDRPAMQRGVIVVGSALGVFLLVLVVVIVLVAR